METDTLSQLKAVDALVETVGLGDLIMMIIGHVEDNLEGLQRLHDADVRKFAHDLRNVACKIVVAQEVRRMKEFSVL